MIYLLTCLLLAAVAAAVTTAQTTNGLLITQTITALQASEPDILDLNPLVVVATTDSYQAQARDATVGILGTTSPPASVAQIRNFYVLACIYFATNGVSNKFTDLLLPGCPVPTWTVDDWLWPQDYCSWTGVTCEIETIVAIELPSNNLHGSFPPEVVLLKSSLLRLNVGDNEYHTSEDPKWLSRMGELQYLLFGSTSWDYPGVPTYLNGARRLVKLDMSNSHWTAGPIRRDAFAGLVYLEYLDMGDNSYNTSLVDDSAVTLPRLLSLTTLYLDRCEFAPNRPRLQFFLGGMPALTHVHLDLTTFDGSIPSTIGGITSLTTFSCAYCGLSGVIPTQFGLLRSLKTLRLQANKLSGTIPLELSQLNQLSTLLLDVNNLVSPVPAIMCTIPNNLTSLSADCDISCSCCTCYCGSSCGNLVDPTASPTGRPTFPPLPTHPPTVPPTMKPTTTPPTDRPTVSPTAAPFLRVTPSPTEEPPTINTGPCRSYECGLLCDVLFTDTLACDAIDCTCRGGQPPRRPKFPTASPTPASCGTEECTSFCNAQDAVSCDTSSCQCPNGAPTAAPTDGGALVLCFSGDSTVQVKNKGPVRMRDLVLGDLVQVNANNVYEPIYSFGHKNNGTHAAAFLAIVTDSSRPALEISSSHMVVMESGHTVPASTIKVGDWLLAASGEPVAVTGIREVMRTGIYAPFTSSGFGIVNGIVVSNYIAYQGSEYLMIGGIETPFTYQWLAHTFNSIHRIAIMAGFSKESYTAAGISHWVDLPNKIVLWLLEQRVFICITVLIPTLSILGLISVVEMLIKDPVTATIFGAAFLCGIRVARNWQISKKRLTFCIKR